MWYYTIVTYIIIKKTWIIGCDSILDIQLLICWYSLHNSFPISVTNTVDHKVTQIHISANDKSLLS